MSTEKTLHREAETYVLSYEDDTQRIWAAEPFIPGSLLLKYDRLHQTLQWVTEDHSSVHPPQLVTLGIPGIPSGDSSVTDPLSFPGIDPSQSLRVVPEVPDRYDAQWYRQKSFRVQPLKVVYQNVFATSATLTPANISTGGQTQADQSVLFPSASNVHLTIPGTFANGNYLLTLSYQPDNVIDFAGDNNTQSSSVGNGATEFSGAGDTRSYYTTLPAIPPAQGWFVEIDYTSENALPATGAFTIQVSWNNIGVYAGDLTFNAAPGEYIRSSISASIYQSIAGPGTLSIQLVSDYTGSETLRINQVRLVSSLTGTSEFQFTLTPADSNTASNVEFKIPATADLFGIPNRADAFKFQFLVNSPTAFQVTNPSFVLTRLDSNAFPVEINGVALDLATSVNPTTDFKAYPFYRTSLLERAVETTRNSYETIVNSALIKPEFRIVTGNFGTTSSLFYTSSPNPLAFPFTVAPNSTSIVLTGTLVSNGVQSPVLANGTTIVLYPANGAPVTRTLTGVNVGDGITTGVLNAILNATYPVSGYGIDVADAITYSATGLPSGITIDPVTGIIGGAPLNTNQGDYPVIITNSVGGITSFTYRIGSGIGTDTYPFPFIWDETCTEAWMSFLQQQEKRIRTVFGANGNQATNGLFPEVPVSENNWFYAQFDFTGYEGYTIVITDAGTDHYRTILQVDIYNSNVVQLDANYTFSSNVTWNIPGAFRLPRASDVGRQCLCPEGLQYRQEGFILANYDAYASLPVMRAFQPWMIDANIYVADDDFSVPQARLASGDELAPVIYPVPQPTLLPFDYAVIRYSWTSVNGRDLDTGTSFENLDPAYNNLAVGWCYSDRAGHGPSVGPSNPPTNTPYLLWGGDNTSDFGYEAVLFNAKQISIDYPSLSSLTIRLTTNWYGERLDGNLQIEFATYLGGTMEQSGTNFINVGGTLVNDILVSRNSATLNEACSAVDQQGTLVYNFASKTGNITNP